MPAPVAFTVADALDVPAQEIPDVVMLVMIGVVVLFVTVIVPVFLQPLLGFVTVTV